jgi:amidase
MMSARELSQAIRSKAASCLEVMQAHLDQIDRLNPSFTAIVSLLDGDMLLAAARSADAELAQGMVRGWMHGFPHAVKDLAATKGLSTTLGSPLFAASIPAHDAIFVDRLRSNGAIIIGKTNVSEFGLGSHSYNPVFGTTRNAYDPTKSAGGSSGGAAVAVALRMLPVADGSDFGGSLRNPAGWNNVFGFRPSQGRVPNAPSPELFLQQLGYEGPMGRSVADLAMLLSVMAGYDARAPLSLTGAPEQFAVPLARDVNGMRIGWLGDLGGKRPMEAGILDLCLAAVTSLETAGCVIEQASLGVDRDMIWESFVTLRQGLFAGRMIDFYRDPEKRPKLKPEAIWEIEGGLALSAVDFYRASERRSAVYQAFLRLFEKFDFLALPSAQVFPFDAGATWPAEIAGVAMDTYHRWMEVTAPATLAGCPTICVPAGFGPQGLPTGVQIIGRGQADFSVLQIGHVYEEINRDRLAILPPALQD